MAIHIDSECVNIDSYYMVLCSDFWRTFGAKLIFKFMFFFSIFLTFKLICIIL